VFQTQAQEVQSTSYKIMLHTMLSHSVPEVSLQEIRLVKEIT